MADEFDTANGALGASKWLEVGVGEDELLSSRGGLEGGVAMRVEVSDGEANVDAGRDVSAGLETERGRASLDGELIGFLSLDSNARMNLPLNPVDFFSAGSGEEAATCCERGEGRAEPFGWFWAAKVALAMGPLARGVDDARVFGEDRLATGELTRTGLFSLSDEDDVRLLFCGGNTGREDVTELLDPKLVERRWLSWS